MRLFLYYALHSVKNQLKKLFKTWVLIFIVVCMLIGGLIGFGAATPEQQAEFAALRAKVDAALAGTKTAKDNAAKCLTTVMIPEALDYPMA